MEARKAYRAGVLIGPDKRYLSKSATTALKKYPAKATHIHAIYIYLNDMLLVYLKNDKVKKIPEQG